MKRKVLSRELHGKISDEKKIAEVLAALPVRVDNTLSNYRVSLTGKRRKIQKKHKKHNYSTEWVDKNSPFNKI